MSDLKPNFVEGDTVKVLIDAEDAHRYTDMLHDALDGRVGKVLALDYNQWKYTGFQWGAQVEFDELCIAHPCHSGSKTWWLPAKHLMKVSE